MYFPASQQNSRCNRVNLIRYLFGSDPTLMPFFFNEDRTQLNFIDRPTTLRMAGRQLDMGQYTLVRLALDVWLGGDPRTKAMDIPAFLTSSQIENLTIMFCVMRATKGCNCQTCKQRFGAQCLSSTFANYYNA
jgi:hypothetical protein